MREKELDGDLYDEKYEDPSPEDFLTDEEERKKEYKPKKKKGNKPFIKGIAVLISAMLIFQVTASFFQTFNLDALQFLRTSYQLSQQEDVQEWRQSVVTIHGEGFFERSQGTGFLISSDGLVVTNHHVVEHHETIGVSLENGDVFEGEVLISDSNVDIALVQIEADDDLPSLSLRDTPVHEEEDIIVIGNPLAFTQIANEGEILAAKADDNVMQISAPIYSGNSGSPVIDENGDVAGVVFARRQVDDPERNSVGLAVPIEEVRERLSELEKG